MPIHQITTRNSHEYTRNHLDKEPTDYPLKRNRSDISIHNNPDYQATKKSDVVSHISDKYFNDIAPMLVPFLFLALVGHEVSSPPEQLPDDNKAIYRSSVASIGVGQAIGLANAVAQKVAPEWCKNNKEKLQKTGIASALASSLAGAGMITNAALLKSPVQGYVTPIAFANLGLTKLAGTTGKVPEKAMKNLGLVALMGAVVGFGFFIEAQKKENDNIGMALSSAAATAFGINTLHAIYQIIKNKDKNDNETTESQTSTEMTNVNMTDNIYFMENAATNFTNPESTQHGVHYFNPTFEINNDQTEH